MRPARVVLTDSDLPPLGIEEEVLGAAGHEVVRAACTSAEDVIAAGAGADALLVQWAPITAAVLEALPTVRVVSRLGIGVDMVDVEAATRLGVAVANTPTYCIEEVAAHTLALILGRTRELVPLDAAVRTGGWGVTRLAPRSVRPSETTVAVIGYGRIGRRVAAALVAIGFRVLVADPYAPAVDLPGAVAAPVPEALAAADVVTLHAPLTAETRHLIDAAAIATMRPGALVVNTCRGGLVDEQALAAALVDGRLGGAALDVFATEPLPAESPLRSAPGVLLTPHAAWYSPAALRALPREAAENVVRVLAGERIPAIVNPAHADVAR